MDTTTYTAVALAGTRLLLLNDYAGHSSWLWSSSDGWQSILPKDVDTLISNGVQGLRCIKGIVGLLGAFDTASCSTDNRSTTATTALTTTTTRFVVVTKVAQCGATVTGQSIYRIIDGCCIQLDDKQTFLILDYTSKMAMAALTEIHSGSLYFTYTQELLEPFGNDGWIMMNTIIEKHLYNNNDFLWNTFLLQMLSAMSGGKLDPSLQLQVIRGFVGQKQLLHDTELTVISRMSRHRAGTRFLQRGADHTGATAITVETEMIVSTPSHAAGWSVLRGSIPLQWQQPMTDIRRHPRAKLLNTLPSSSPPSSHDKAMHEQSMTTTATTTPVQRLDVVDTVTASSPSTTTIPTAFSNEAFEAFRQHVKWIQARHGPSVTFANLIRDHDCTEALLSNAFRLMVHYADMPNVAYLSTPVLRRSGSLYDAAASAYSYASRSGFTVMDTTQLNKSSNESVNTVPHILRKQQGCLRVNCMDCLDRTGLVQFRVAMLMLPQMLTAVERSVDNVDISRAMRSLWANNNDALAQQYTGSGAVAGWLVRHGGRCHLLRQLYDTQTLIARAYINTLVDPKRQRLIDTWHGLNTTTATATIALSLNDQVIFDIKSTIPLDKDQVTANRLLDALLRLHQRIGPIAIKHVYQFLAGLFWICLITLFVNLFSFSKSATSTSSTFTETTSSNTITNNTNTSTNTREKRRIIRQA